jgi:hypothetical protein
MRQYWGDCGPRVTTSEPLPCFVRVGTPEDTKTPLLIHKVRLNRAGFHNCNSCPERVEMALIESGEEPSWQSRTQLNSFTDRRRSETRRPSWNPNLHYGVRNSQLIPIHICITYLRSILIVSPCLCLLLRGSPFHLAMRLSFAFLIVSLFSQ